MREAQHSPGSGLASLLSKLSPRSRSSSPVAPSGPFFWPPLVCRADGALCSLMQVWLPVRSTGQLAPLIHLVRGSDLIVKSSPVAAKGISFPNLLSSVKSIRCLHGAAHGLLCSVAPAGSICAGLSAWEQEPEHRGGAWRARKMQMVGCPGEKSSWVGGTAMLEYRLGWLFAKCSWPTPRACVQTGHFLHTDFFVKAFIPPSSSGILHPPFGFCFVRQLFEAFRGCSNSCF